MTAKDDRVRETVSRTDTNHDPNFTTPQLTPTETKSTKAKMSSTFFRITLIRSAIGLPSKSLNVLKALGLRKRMATVFHPVTPAVAGQIMKVKELVAVSEVDEPMTRAEVHRARVPEKGFYVESKMVDGQRVKIVEEA